MSRVIDMPLCPVEIPLERQCEQILVSGERCAHEATQHGRCDVHYGWATSAMAQEGIVMPEDAISLQVMLMRAMDMLLNDGVDHKKAKCMVEVCKLMAINVRAYQYERGDLVSARRRLPRK